MAVCPSTSCSTTRSGRSCKVLSPGVSVVLLRVVEMPEQQLVGEGERAAQPAARELEVQGHARVDAGGELGSRGDRVHVPEFRVRRVDE